VAEDVETALWHPAYVGLGSNLDEPLVQIRRACAALSQVPHSRLVALSALYASQPMGPVAQPDFVNAVAGMLTQLPVTEFFQVLRRLERDLGREPPRVRWGPRRIDLDLLVFGAERVQSAELTLPHPGIVERNFVLYPLAEVAPELEVPGHGRVARLAGRVAATGLRRLAPAT
jgi:2-amino-4-hydroxy-6-hydroxymethyldihydropteridine diphosphokinase